MDICSFENLNQFSRKKSNEKRIRKNSKIINVNLTNRNNTELESSFNSNREDALSQANRSHFINSTKLTVDEIQMQRRSIDEGKFRETSLKANFRSSSPSTSRRSISSVIPCINNPAENIEFRRKYSASSRIQKANETSQFENRLTADPVIYQTSRRNTEILSTHNFFNESLLLQSNSRSNSSRSSEEFNNKTRSWCSNDSDFLSPDRYQPYSEFRKSSSLSVPESNLLKSKSFSSFKIDTDYGSQNSQEIINAETLVVPANFNRNLVRHKSCDGSPSNNYILNMPDKNRNKRSKKKSTQRKYSHEGEPDTKNDKPFWSQAIVSLKRKQEAFFKKLPKPHQSEESTVDPVYHLLRCASYTAHNPNTCECPCHTLANSEVLKHAQSQITLPTINFKPKSK